MPILSSVFTSPTPPTASWGRDLLLLTLLCAVLFGAGLGRYSLSNPDEGRYAEIPREMLASNDYVTPRLNGVKYFEKPPLVYWLVAASLHLFGTGETAARTVPALFATLGVLLLYAAVRRAHGRESAWWAALVLATSLLYFVHSRILLLDMVVSVLMSTVLLCFILGIRESPGTNRRMLFYGLYASAALATLAKGLIGFLLPGAVMFLWLLLFNQWRRLLPFHLTSGLLLFALIAVPWHALVAQRNPEWASFYFIHEHWLRFTTTTHGRFEPWWYFLPYIVLGLFPWTGFLWHGLRQATTGGWRERQKRADDWFPPLWAVFILLFFSASQSKLVPYVLPIFPPLAWIIGRYLAGLQTKPGSTTDWRRPLHFSLGMSAMLGMALIVVLLKPGIIRPGYLALLRPLVWPAAIALLGSAMAAWWLVRNQRPRHALGSLLGGTGLLYFAIILAAPVLAKPGTKSLAEIVAREAGAQDLIFHYHEYFHDFSYYARRTVGTVATQGELEVFLDAEAQRSGRFLGEDDLHGLWTGSQQIFLVTRRSELPELQKYPWFQTKLLGEEPGHLLLTNHY